MKAFAIRYPFIFGILVSLVAIVGLMWPFWLTGLAQGVQILLARATDILIAVFLLTWFKWWQEAGFTRVRSWKILLPYLPLILIILVGCASVLVSTGITVRDPALILLGAASFLAGGFVEEALFRGVVLRAFLPSYRLLKAALLSALVFALAHVPALLFGQDLGATALQFVRTFLVGFAFVAPLAYTRNIWPLVILHALMNFSSFLSSGSITLIATESPEISQVLAEVVLWSLLAGYSFWLLRLADRRLEDKTLTTGQQLVVHRADR